MPDHTTTRHTRLFHLLATLSIALGALAVLAPQIDTLAGALARSSGAPAAEGAGQTWQVAIDRPHRP